jgi:hypothetical protein
MTCIRVRVSDLASIPDLRKRRVRISDISILRWRLFANTTDKREWNSETVRQQPHPEVIKKIFGNDSFPLNGDVITISQKYNLISEHNGTILKYLLNKKKYLIIFFYLPCLKIIIVIKNLSKVHIWLLVPFVSSNFVCYYNVQRPNVLISLKQNKIVYLNKDYLIGANVAGCDQTSVKWK